MTPNEKRRHVEEVGATGDNHDVGKQSYLKHANENEYASQF
jgi:hypothetical protein